MMPIQSATNQANSALKPALNLTPDPKDIGDSELRDLVEKMQERERRIMKLINAKTPERIEHDLRNVLNELVLLRALFEPKEGD